MTPKSTDAVQPDDSYLDLGALLIPGSFGVQVHLDLSPDAATASGVRIAQGGTAAQFQVFARPTTDRMWPRIRDEILAQLADQDVQAETVLGPWGTEISVVLPTADANGSLVLKPTLFVGIDGERWMLRIVVTGDAAVDSVARDRFNEFVDALLVHRGDEPFAPGEPLPLRMP